MKSFVVFMRYLELVTDIKEILRAINIRYLNFNMRHHQLRIGLQNKEQVDEVEDLLHHRMFTESHYNHYMKQEKENNSSVRI